MWEHIVYRLPPTSPLPEFELQPEHMPWSEIEPATFWCKRWCPTSWATMARARDFLKCLDQKNKKFLVFEIGYCVCVGAYLQHTTWKFTTLVCLFFLLPQGLTINQRWELRAFSGLFWACTLRHGFLNFQEYVKVFKTHSQLFLPGLFPQLTSFSADLFAWKCLQ